MGAGRRVTSTGEALLYRAVAVDAVIGGPSPFNAVNSNQEVMSADEIEKHYSLERVADLTSYSVRTLRDFIKAGELVPVRWGRTYRITETELRRFMAARAAAAIPEQQRPGSRPGMRQDERSD